MTLKDGFLTAKHHLGVAAGKRYESAVRAVVTNDEILLPALDDTVVPRCRSLLDDERRLRIAPYGYRLHESPTNDLTFSES